MPSTVNGYSLNDVNEAANWSTREKALLTAIVNLLPPSGSKDTTAQHLHDRLGFNGQDSIVTVLDGMVGVGTTVPTSLLDLYEENEARDCSIVGGSQILVRNPGSGDVNGDAGIELQTSRASYGIFARGAGIDDDFLLMDLTNAQALLYYDWSAGLFLGYGGGGIAVDIYLAGIARVDVSENCLHFNDNKGITIGNTPAEPGLTIGSNGTDVHISAAPSADINISGLGSNINVMAAEKGDINLTTQGTTNGIQLTPQSGGFVGLANIPAAATQPESNWAGKLWRTANHATLPNGVLMIGI